jgi:subtilisin family serine protease
MVYEINNPGLYLDLFENVLMIIKRGGIITAASGNDSEGNPHKSPAYPARFKEVIGVGSTKSKGTISSFSNKPGRNGFMVFSGEIDDENHIKDDIPTTVDGILSIYVNPPGVLPVSGSAGWAQWTGTSFSTGVVTGVLAILLSKGYNRTQGINILKSSSKRHGGFQVLPVSQVRLR